MNSSERILFDQVKQEAQKYENEFHRIFFAVSAAQRGIKRLKRKLEVRDEYVKATEAMLPALVEGIADGHPSVARWKLARENLGLVKKSRPESK
jgi:hypothetical protein